MVGEPPKSCYVSSLVVSHSLVKFTNFANGKSPRIVSVLSMAIDVVINGYYWLLSHYYCYMHGLLFVNVIGYILKWLIIGYLMLLNGVSVVLVGSRKLGSLAPPNTKPTT